MAEYESPKLGFEKVQTNEKIADVCWGYFANGGTGKYLYYDNEGAGYVQVTYTGSISNCKSVSNGQFTYQAFNCADVAKSISEAQSIINNVGPNAGSPFKGSDRFYDHVVDVSGGINP